MSNAKAVRYNSVVADELHITRNNTNPTSAVTLATLNQKITEAAAAPFVDSFVISCTASIGSNNRHMGLTSSNTSTSLYRHPISADCVLRRVEFVTPQVASGQNFTIFRNEVSTGVVGFMPNDGSQAFSMTGLSIAFSAGDNFTILVTRNPSNALRVNVTMYFERT